MKQQGCHRVLFGDIEERHRSRAGIRMCALPKRDDMRKGDRARKKWVPISRSAM